MHVFIKKLNALLLAIITVTLTLATPIESFAASKTLNKPQKFAYYWDGDTMQLVFSAIDGASQYDVYNADTGEYISSIDTNQIALKFKNGTTSRKVDKTFAITAIPSNSSINQSDFAYVSISDTMPDYTDVTGPQSAACLSKSELIKYLKSCGYTPTVSSDNDYTIVAVSVDNPKYDAWRATFDALENGYSTINEYSDKTDAIGKAFSDDDESAQKTKDTLDIIVGIVGAYKGVQKGKENAQTDYYYYYETGKENRSAKLFQLAYSASYNAEPDFSDFEKDSDGYYIAYNTLFRRKIKYTYKKQDGQWIVYALPAGYDGVIYKCQ